MAQNSYNLLIITPDQMRADYMGCYGHPAIGTRHLDALAKEGIRFDSCYCAAPLCGPSRISFATSTYFSEHNHRNYGATVSPDVPNLVSALKRKGYRTGMFGKNHLFTYERLPELWDELDEICLGNCDDHEKYVHAFSSFTMEEDHPYHITGRLTDETVDFIRRQESPFIAWVNYQDPHPAFACPKPYDTLFKPEDVVLDRSYYDYDKSREPVRCQVWREHSRMDLCTEEDMKKAAAAYMGQIRYVDDMMGRLMETLKETGHDKDTIVLFFSDHGELLGNHGMTHKIPVFYECLSRIPVIIRHPEGVGAGMTFEGLAEEVDLAPTILEFMGIAAPPTMVGISWAKSIECGYTGRDAGRETALCEAGIAVPTLKTPVEGLELKAPFAPTSYGCGSMLRKGDYKLSIYADDCCELYDLSRDPGEIHNLYGMAEYSAVQQEMTLELLKRVMSVKVRDTGKMEWDYAEYPVDVREEPLEK